VGLTLASLPEPTLTVERLIAGGFEHVGSWQLDSTGRLILIGSPTQNAGVYAFVIGGFAQYVGLASTNLAKRLYFYGRPGVSQSTNIRLNGLLIELLRAGDKVDIYTVSPPDLEWNGWPVSGAEGLESALIRDHVPVFNKKGVPAAAAVAAVKEAAHSYSKTQPTRPDGQPSDSDRIRSFVERKLFAPARADGQKFITVAAREVHDRLGLKNAFPTVCQALAGGKLQHDSRVRLVARDGPERSSTTAFRFELL
jgi:hypothetical protein